MRTAIACRRWPSRGPAPGWDGTSEAASSSSSATASTTSCAVDRSGRGRSPSAPAGRPSRSCARCGRTSCSGICPTRPGRSRRSCTDPLGSRMKRKDVRLDWRKVELRLRHPWTIARGSSVTKTNVLTRLACDGVEGLGEAAPNARYGEDAESVLRALEILAPLLGDDPSRRDEILDRIGTALPGQNAAKASIDIALHDWIGRNEGTPLWRSFGADPARTPPTSMSIGIDEIAVMQERVREAAGFQVLKVKVDGSEAGGRGDPVDGRDGRRPRGAAAARLRPRRGEIRPLPGRHADHRRRGRPDGRRYRSTGAGLRRDQRESAEGGRPAHGADDDRPRAISRHEGDARLHDRDLDRHHRSGAPVAPRRLRRSRRQPPDRRRPVPRRARPGREAGAAGRTGARDRGEPRGPVALRSATRARFVLALGLCALAAGAARAEAPGASRVDPKRAEFRRKLEVRLARLDSGLDGASAYVIRDLSGGDAFEKDGDAVFPAASTIKVTVLLELFKRAEEGSIDLARPVPID